MTEELEIYVCYRVDMLLTPRPESVKGTCGGCGAPIWMMPHAPTRMRIVCTECAKPMVMQAVAEGEDIVILPGATARLDEPLN